MKNGLYQTLFPSFRTVKKFWIYLFSYFVAFNTYACPKVGGLIDFNCDRKHTIVVTGDSIVYGRGDELYNDQGGIVPRLKSIFPKSKITKLGFPGITTLRLFGFFKALFVAKPKSPVTKAMLQADIIIIDVGRNDSPIEHPIPPEYTIESLKQLTAGIAAKIKKKTKVAPLMVDAYLLPTTREPLNEFIDGVNQLFAVKHSPSFPVFLRFDLVDPSTLSSDGLHPRSAGYDQMAALAAEYIQDEAQKRSIALRPDSDQDGIYDLFEKLKFKTKPDVADTDSDGLKDGKEVFTDLTDPTKADTDGDTFKDGDEIAAGSDPKNRASIPPGGIIPEPTPAETPIPTNTPEIIPATPTPESTTTPTPTPTVAV